MSKMRRGKKGWRGHIKAKMRRALRASRRRLTRSQKAARARYNQLRG